MRNRMFAFLFVAVTAATFMLPSRSALAGGPSASFTAGGAVYVSSLSTPIPAGISGRVRIQLETIASLLPLASDAPELVGKVLNMSQKSNELFSSADFTTAVVLDGSSVGKFEVVDPATGAVVASGQYYLNVSNGSGCQVLDQGHWSTTGQSGLRSQGDVTVCLNFVPFYGTFVGTVTFSGTLR